MMKEKKSFLERLTGAKKVEMSMDMRSEHMEPTPVYAEEETEEVMVINPESTNNSNMETNWNSEAEGQLTIDVYQTENDIVIKSTIAGVRPEDLDVSINNEMITIKGSRRNEENINPENYYYQECYWGPFSRSVVLPVDVIADKIEASLKNGILTIRLPKADITKTKKIPVRGF